MNRDQYEAEALRAEQWIHEAEKVLKLALTDLADRRRQLREGANAELAGNNSGDTLPPEFVLQSAANTLANMNVNFRFDALPFLAMRLERARNKKR